MGAVASSPLFMGLVLWILFPKSENTLIEFLHSVMNNVIRVLFITGGATLFLFFLIRIVQFLYQGNPYNRGKLFLRYKQRTLAHQVKKAMIDTGIVNPRYQSNGFEVADVYPNLDKHSIFIRIEVVGDTAKELENIESLINATTKKKFANLVVHDLSQYKNGRWFTIQLRDSSVSQRLILS
ncbi:MAG: hypothetical protein K0Q56_824, partial [Sporolactobacillus laevolacticus]|nr:hypothetical protein [Sporolactobacillus laevolacticus]